MNTVGRASDLEFVFKKNLPGVRERSVTIKVDKQ